MKPLILILGFCAVGYGIDHWQEITHRRQNITAEIPHGLTLYSTKSSGPCVQLEQQLNERGIAYERKDLDEEANKTELQEKFERVGKMNCAITPPVAEIDGVLYPAVKVDVISKKLH